MRSVLSLQVIGWLSATSSQWWAEILTEAMGCYERWLRSDPLMKLRILPALPDACARQPWMRLEQRAQTMLLAALPEEIKGEALAMRSTTSVQLVFRVLTKYQPGGLGERTHLLKQLVEVRQPQSVGDMVNQLQMWRRWLRRAQELRVNVPDATLLMAALDKISQPLSRSAAQSAFRLSSIRAMLMVDVSPSLEGVERFAEALLAEGENAFHGGEKTGPKVTVKAMTTTPTTQPSGAGGTTAGGGVGKDQKSDGWKDKKPVVAADGKKPLAPCRFFQSDDGCRRGAFCTFGHDPGDAKGKCWQCGSVKHMKKDCPVKGKPDDGAVNTKKDGQKPEVRAARKDDPKPASPEARDGSKVDSASGEKPKDPVEKKPLEEGGLLQEAIGLLKSLSGPKLKSMKKVEAEEVKVSVLGVRDRRALLDGGATHCLRQAASDEGWDSSVEVQVALASGSVTLRQVPWTKTLISRNEVQPIVPLGVLAEIGYSIRWEGKEFEVIDTQGKILDSELENSCPTVSEQMGLQLIREIEKQVMMQKARLAVLNGEKVPPGVEAQVDAETKRWLEFLKKLFPEVPAEILGRVVPSGKYSVEHLPWNRHTRRRIRKAQEVIIHLFSGPDEKTWKSLENQHRRVLCVDLELGKGHNILSDHVASYLFELCQTGKVKAILAGPPCRSVSRLRHTMPGPPPLRTRWGETRFGLEGLSDQLKALVEGDTVLFLRSLFFYMVADESALVVGGRSVAYLVESPQDPESYAPAPEENPEKACPSFWCWEEWKSFKEFYQMLELSFDQGPMGHTRRKPTTIGTNIKILEQLSEVRGPGKMRGLQQTLEERLVESKKWAEWAPGFKRALVIALEAHFEDAKMARLTMDQWKAHLGNDHLPFRKECRTCVQAAGRGKMHKRVVHPNAFTLAVDLGGPHVRGVDQGGKAPGKATYMVVGVYTIPVSKLGASLLPPEAPSKEREEMVRRQLLRKSFPLWRRMAW